ncbi:DUF1311 domain-containing protein [Xanthomonas campestris pv. campestris]|uniref:lysozyme inhibitor LprI family protein n=1 Tax=Xanthomonas campestris TaxID=339 RepID=UPI0009B7E343|nr:lysozyme inhibitor LprI family protein [Xanthomonas campestris]MCF8792614.1 DUF1311 domain-containing protein [Xanthomonas campestris pv. campestris]MCF8807871.1 DUF1311 domain-containing protein [Xanthomonas campestris pv. campestris]MCF8823762.1 DUF1311 domain-containing protein [Xanthomonas campestris pv. campestris]MCF8831140.1 DUF1311 domain-containing protein [Xanthomonas campestris pv. campestris]MCF8834611.1 DUF1311 domain-containing protein [Xanthomonas campestris pv. campestris]
MQAAGTRALTDFGLSADAFDAAQAAWRTYSERQCGNVRVLWGTASVALAKAASCRVDLNDQRSHDLWKSYLTYADRTPSVMPEPALRSGK